jgi:osmoprotectant transport system ATP-binding protein
MRSGRLVQFAPPGELLAHPADDFVAEFCGSDRGLKRLALLTVGGADIDTAVDRSSVSSNAPVLSPATTLRDALARMLASEAQVGIVMDGDRYLGVLTLSTIGHMIRDDT